MIILVCSWLRRVGNASQGVSIYFIILRYSRNVEYQNYYSGVPIWGTTLEGAPPGPLEPPRGPGCLRNLEKNCENSQKIYKKLTCIKIPQIIALRPILGYLDYPGGPQGGQKVIWWCKKFFLAESIWSFRQNTLYLSQVSGLGGDEPWFWLCPFTIPPYFKAFFER